MATTSDLSNKITNNNSNITNNNKKSLINISNNEKEKNITKSYFNHPTPKNSKHQIRIINKLNHELYHVYPKTEQENLKKNFNSNNFYLMQKTLKEQNTLILQIVFLISIIIIILALIALICIQTRELKEFMTSSNRDSGVKNIDGVEVREGETEEDVLRRLKAELENKKMELERMKVLLEQRKMELLKVRFELEETNNTLYRMIKYSGIYQ